MWKIYHVFLPIARFLDEMHELLESAVLQQSRINQSVGFEMWVVG